MSRKTFNVEQLKLNINEQLRGSYGGCDYRKGIADVLESVLMKTGNYAGFRYLRMEN